MTLSWNREATIVLAALASSAARALLVAGLVALALTVFRVRRAAWRLGAWTYVLWAALMMPALGWLLPSWPVPVPAQREFAWLGRNVATWTSAPPPAVERRHVPSPSDLEFRRDRFVRPPTAGGVGTAASGSTTLAQSRALVSVMDSD